MERKYAVTVCGNHTGTVTVQKQGLYYLFSCRCALRGDMIYRLMVTCGTVQEKLGILVPENGNFTLNTKIPVKRIGAGELSFQLIPNDETFSKSFIPIYPEEPFAYISRLKESFLTLRDGQPGINVEKVQEL